MKSWAVKNAYWSGTWNVKERLKDWRYGAVGQKYMERPMRMKASSVKIFVSDIYVFQETSIMEGDLNNQVNKMTWPISVIGHAKQWTSE